MQRKNSQTNKIQEELNISGVVGLDISLTGTGVVRFPKNSSEDILIMNVGTDSKFGVIEERLKYSARGIMGIILSSDIVFIEDYAFSISPRKSSLATLAELGGIVKYMCWRKTGIWPIPVASTSIKKWLSGKGNLKQEDFKIEAYKRYKREFRTKDEVIAYALADFGSCFLKQPLTRILGKRETEQIGLFRKKHLKIIEKIKCKRLQKNEKIS